MAATPPSNDRRPRYRAEDLRAFTAAVLEHYGMPSDDAVLGAEVLVDADLMGIESHGIAHLPWHFGYAPGFKAGVINAKPNITVLRDSPVAASWDADSGFGVVVGAKAMRATIEKARGSGMGMIAVRNGRHFGAAGYYAHMAARADMIGMAMCNVPPIAFAAGGLDRVYGTNPIAFGAPVEGESPFLLDIATTAVAGGKLEIAMRQGKTIPHGWAANGDGSPTDDPQALRKGGALLPLGSSLTTSSHKGYGLGLMVDVLTGILPGAKSAMFMDRGHQGYWFAAWRIDAFRDPVEFKAEMKQMADAVRATRPEPGVASVLVPGDPEWAARADRVRNGVPLDDETIQQLTELGEEVGRPLSAPVGP